MSNLHPAIMDEPADMIICQLEADYATAATVLPSGEWACMLWTPFNGWTVDSTTGDDSATAVDWALNVVID